MTPEKEAEQAIKASLRIVRVLDEFRKEGCSADVIYLALIDACVRAGKFYSPKTPIYTILRRFARLAISMAKDEEKDLKHLVTN